MVLCGFCKVQGHRISACAAPGADEARNKRQSEQGARSAEVATEERRKYQITLDSMDLPSPKPSLGRIRSDWAQVCSTPDGVISTLFPKSVMVQILLHMNRNLDCKNSEAEVRSTFPSTRKRRKCLGPASAQKGTVLSHSEESIIAPSYVEVRSSTRLNFPTRKRHWEPIKLEPFSLSEFHFFLAILLYIAKHNISSIRSLWSTNVKKPIHPFARNLMSLTRFEIMYSCFNLKDLEMEEIEGQLVTRMQEIWVPSTFCCCDESLVPYKGRKTNPHHVFIMRKPHPHGVKVFCHLFMFIL